MTPAQVLTGATGGLGAHILSLLLPLPHISKVYILLRGPNPKQRLHATFSNLHLPLPLLTSPKLSILTSTLHSPHLGLSETTYTSLLEGATHIIHCAWPVTFTLTLSAFCFALAALRNLLQLSLEVKAVSPAHFLFCSSISVALGKSSFASSDFTPQITVPGAPISDLTQASRTGYAQSKLVAENIIANAVRDVGANATILRIGQIVGDTDYGWWNDSEILPMIIRSALTMGILPELDMSCEWLPVDVLARSILQIGGLDNDDSSLPQRDGQLVYNLVSPHSFRWTMDLLPALSAAGLSFRPVSFETWVHRLRSLSLDISSTTHHLLRTPTTASDTTTSSSSPSTSDTSKTPAANPLQNPALKLVDFFEGPFQSDNAAGGGKGIKFETEGARKVANALRDAPKIIESGLLGKMVSAWLQRWREEAEGKGNER